MMAANQIQARNNGPPRPNGLLSIPASATKKPATNRADTMPKSSALRPKIVVRRLPPGLTQGEFNDCMGTEWQIHQGKVDWAVYKPGKISTEYITPPLSKCIVLLIESCSLAKPSKPSRAYLHLMNQKHVDELAEKVRTTDFSDAKASSKDSVLLGPPVVEYDPFGRIPSNKPRKDLREGTIDQDQEYMDFLESLTNPLPKVSTVDQDGDAVSKAKEKVTITPLVQFLKDKKANKGKEQASSAKGSKHNRQDSKEGKSSSTEKKTSAKAATGSPAEKRSAQAIKVENAARDAVKVLNKQASNTKKSSEPPAAPSPASTTSTDTVASPLADKKRERGNASAAARILQRDLGLGGSVRGGRGGRRTPARPETGKATTSAPSSRQTKESDPDAEQPSIVASAAIGENDATKKGALVTEKTNPTPIQPPTGPAASRVPPKTPSQPRNATVAAAARTPSVSPTSTQAFLKHANPSQGITEPLLEAAFAPFGTVSKVEIDKKKGFAYVDFAEPEGLQNAVKASPVKVAQGQVVVLERKTGPTLQARNARGGGAVGPVGGGQQSVMGQRGGGPPAMMANRGIPPSGPRGGRGGARGRGAGRGGFRGGFGGPNASAPKVSHSASVTPEVAAPSSPAAEVQSTKGVTEES